MLWLKTITVGTLYFLQTQPLLEIHKRHETVCWIGSFRNLAVHGKWETTRKWMNWTKHNKNETELLEADTFHENMIAWE